MEKNLEIISSLCKRRGFIFPSSEIYGGINGFWDYGPLGSELKRNIRDAWWHFMVQWRNDVVGLDATIIMHPRVWEASGHAAGFADPMVDCKDCKKRYRADQLCEEQGKQLIRFQAFTTVHRQSIGHLCLERQHQRCPAGFRHRQLNFRLSR